MSIELCLNGRVLLDNEYYLDIENSLVEIKVPFKSDDMLYIRDPEGSNKIHIFIHQEGAYWRCFCDNCIESHDQLMMILRRYAGKYLCADEGQGRFHFVLFESINMNNMMKIMLGESQEGSFSIFGSKMGSDNN